MIKENENSSFWKLTHAPELLPFKRSNVKVWVLFEIAIKSGRKYSDYALWKRCQEKRNNPTKKKDIQIEQDILTNKLVLSILRDIEINSKSEINNQRENSNELNKKGFGNPKFSPNLISDQVHDEKTDPAQIVKPEQYRITNPFIPKKPFHLNSINIACKDLTNRGFLKKISIMSEKCVSKNQYALTPSGFYILVYLLFHQYVLDKKINDFHPPFSWTFSLNFIALYWPLWRNHPKISNEARIMWAIIEKFDIPNGLFFNSVLGTIFLGFLEACITYSPDFIESKDKSSTSEYEDKIWTYFFTNTLNYLISSDDSFNDYIYEYEIACKEDKIECSNPMDDLYAIIKNEVLRDMDNGAVLWDIIHQSERVLEKAKYLIKT